MTLEKMPASGLISEIENAIAEKNYGQMYIVGDEMMHRAINDKSWLEAVIVVTGYLLKSTQHLWNAVDLSKRAAIASDEDSEIQKMTIDTLEKCIEALPTFTDRAEAAYSVLALAPVKGKLMLTGIVILWNNAQNIEENDLKKRYLKIAVYYAPADHPVRLQAEIALKNIPEGNMVYAEFTNSVWSSFLEKHRQETETTPC